MGFRKAMPAAPGSKGQGGGSQGKCQGSRWRQDKSTGAGLGRRQRRTKGRTPARLAAACDYKRMGTHDGALVELAAATFQYTTAELQPCYWIYVIRHCNSAHITSEGTSASNFPGALHNSLTKLSFSKLLLKRCCRPFPCPQKPDAQLQILRITASPQKQKQNEPTQNEPARISF